jgi:cell division septation protein DedD
VDPDVFLQLYNAVFSSSGPGAEEYRVQLGAFRSLENANDLWQRIWRTQWDLLGQSEPRIHSLDLGDGGQLHLLQIGALASARKAESLCQALSKRGLDCFVVRPRGNAAEGPV